MQVVLAELSRCSGAPPVSLNSETRALQDEAQSGPIVCVHWTRKGLPSLLMPAGPFF